MRVFRARDQTKLARYRSPYLNPSFIAVVQSHTCSSALGMHVPPLLVVEIGNTGRLGAIVRQERSENRNRISNLLAHMRIRTDVVRDFTQTTSPI